MKFIIYKTKMTLNMINLLMNLIMRLKTYNKIIENYTMIINNINKVKVKCMNNRLKYPILEFKVNNNTSFKRIKK